jgi:histidyl-tRNA synthetase
VFYRSVKLGKQIDYAAGKGIPYVIFINAETGAIEARNLSTRVQEPINDLAAWAREITR